MTQAVCLQTLSPWVVPCVAEYMPGMSPCVLQAGVEGPGP